MNTNILLMLRSFSCCVLFLLLIGMMGSGCKKTETEDSLSDNLRSKLSERSPTGNFDYFLLPKEGDFDNFPNQDPLNPMTTPKVALGKMLFFETALAQDAIADEGKNTYSCGTCHIPEASFTPGRFQAIGDGAVGHGGLREMRSTYEVDELDCQGVRPLTILNATYVTNMFWNGRFGPNGVNVGTEDVWHFDSLLEVNTLGYEGLETQHIEALDIHRMDMTEMLLDDYGYREMYDAAFPEINENERYGRLTTAFALSAYVRSAVTNEAPFQEWLEGEEEALTEKQMRGALLFLGKANCYKCHNSPSFSSMRFKILGTKDLYERGGLLTDVNDGRNYGRGDFTRREEEMFAFKIPQLYNLKDYTHYFHGSSKESLEEVLDYKIAGVSENPLVANDGLSPSFLPLELSEEEQDELIDFLRNGLYDANLDRYVPEHVLSNNCIPSNDEESILQLDCN